MPRPAGRTGTRQITATPNKQSPMRLAMNDDRGEKAARLQSRQALQEIHMNEIRAAVSPMRKLHTNHRPRQSIEASPHTPQSEAGELRKRAAGNKQNAVKSGLQSNRNAQRDLSDVVLGEGNLTPMKRMPVLANFEEWMKLATDNKINATNSWNFALIDYFHDMSLLKDGPGGQVNFQKASCTLDGCVKIYTSRVDSVATETGRLLSGLADSATDEAKKRRKNGEEDEEGDEEGDEDEDDDGEGGKKKQKKRPARSHEATLAPSFASLQLKKLELEFAVDPLFKKASADFDEGGAKGLLLNHLSIDARGRIVFDSSDDTEDASMSQQQEQQGDEDEMTEKADQIKDQDETDETIDLTSLAAKFFPDLDCLDSKDVCPSMKGFTLGSADLTIPSLKAPEDWRDANKPKSLAATNGLDLADQTGIFLDGSNDLGFDDDDDGGLGGFEMGDDVGFGEGGEAWAKDAAIEPSARVVSIEDEPNEGAQGDGYAVTMQHRFRDDAEQETVMAYFDKAFNSRGKGKLAFNMSLENWRIQKIQKARQSEAVAATGPTRTRKEKEPFEIDFNGPLSDNLQQLLQAPAVNNSTISLPRTQLKTKGRNLLDKDDEIVDVRAMMRLWTKPKCRIGRRKGVMEVIDEGFGSRARGAITTNDRPVTTDQDEDDFEERQGDYDANFFADDDPLPFMFDGPLPIDDDDDGADDNNEPGFVDAREMLSPGPEGRQLDALGVPEHGEQSDNQHQPANDVLFAPVSQSEMLPGSFGTQLVTQQGRRLRPEYVNYARTAKKVDVRALKENMWKGMSTKLITSINFDQPQPQPQPSTVASTNNTAENMDMDMMDIDDAAAAETQKEPPPPPNEHQESKEGTLKFTQMISDLQSVYPDSQMKDISTSYCFICLLHLANEKGLVLEGGREDGTMGEIFVSKDEGVDEGYVGE